MTNEKRSIEHLYNTDKERREKERRENETKRKGPQYSLTLELAMSGNPLIDVVNLRSLEVFFLC